MTRLIFILTPEWFPARKDEQPGQVDRPIKLSVASIHSVNRMILYHVKSGIAWMKSHNNTQCLFNLKKTLIFYWEEKLLSVRLDRYLYNSRMFKQIEFTLHKVLVVHYCAIDRNTWYLLSFVFVIVSTRITLNRISCIRLRSNSEWKIILHWQRLWFWLNRNVLWLQKSNIKLKLLFIQRKDISTTIIIIIIMMFTILLDAFQWSTLRQRVKFLLAKWPPSQWEGRLSFAVWATRGIPPCQCIRGRLTMVSH